MTPAEKFVEALQTNMDAMYEQRLHLWMLMFAMEWKISESTVHKYMPVRKRVYPSKEEVTNLIAQWKTDQEIRVMYKLTEKQLKALVIKTRLWKPYEKKEKPVERELHKGKWDRSVPKPYWEDIWEIHTMWPAKFIKFNTPLWSIEK